MKIVLNEDGFRQLRTDPAIMAYVADKAQAVADAAGSGFEVDGPEISGGRGRARARVWAATSAARARNIRDNALLRALGGSGGS